MAKKEENLELTESPKSEFKLSEGQFLGIHEVLLKYHHRLEKLEKRSRQKDWQKGFLEGFEMGLGHSKK